GLSVDNNSQFGLGDLYVQPVWLGLTRTHWDFAFAYGFYAPVGEYSVKRVAFPQIGATVTTPSPDNIGLGFWTHQFQGAVAWYPWEHRGTAVSVALTYELHHEKQDIDVTPGSHLSLNWGVSQYVPLTSDKTNLLEVGIAGYSQWQVTDDTGSAAGEPGVHDQVHAIGLILGWANVPMGFAITARYSYEFASEDRFQGSMATLNIAKKM
ncbi:MAG: transporter, partial [Rhodospirillales bacterium]